MANINIIHPTSADAVLSQSKGEIVVAISKQDWLSLLSRVVITIHNDAGAEVFKSSDTFHGGKASVFVTYPVAGSYKITAQAFTLIGMADCLDTQNIKIVSSPAPVYPTYNKDTMGMAMQGREFDQFNDKVSIFPVLTTVYTPNANDRKFADVLNSLPMGSC